MKIKHPLALFMAVYAAVVLAAAAFGISYFRSWLESYENTRPVYVADSYAGSVDRSHVSSLAAEAMAVITDDSEKDKCLDDIMALYSDCKNVKSISESTDAEQVYYLRSGDRTFARYVLNPGEPDRYGHAPWSVSSDELLPAAIDSGMFAEAEATVPAGYTVLCNGTPLGDESISAENIEIDAFVPYYDNGSPYSFPYLRTYSTGLHYGAPSVSILAPDGREVSAEEALAASLDNCSPDEKEAIDSRISAYINRYVNYTSGMGGREFTEQYYSSVASCIVPGSDLMLAMRLAMDGISYANSKGDEILAINVLDRYKLDETHFFANVTFDVETKGIGLVSTHTYGMKLILEDTYNNGRLYVEAMEMT